MNRSEMVAALEEHDRARRDRRVKALPKVVAWVVIGLLSIVLLSLIATAIGRA